MKTIIKLFILLLLSCVVSHSYAQTWSYRPTVFGNGFVSTVNNQAQAATYLGFPSLPGNNTWTGTNTFLAAGLFQANHISHRVLYSMPTNQFFATVNTNAAGSITNSGDFANCTSFLNLTIPPLLGSNSSVYFTIATECTNANTSAAVLSFYVGTNTNYIGDTALFAATATRAFTGNPGGTLLFLNAASFTNQIVNTPFFTVSVPGVSITGISNFVDTSVSWPLRIGISTTANHTNRHIIAFSIAEMVR